VICTKFYELVHGVIKFCDLTDKTDSVAIVSTFSERSVMFTQNMTF